METKENIRKRFEFDLNMGVFKSNSFKNRQIISFEIFDSIEVHALAHILDYLGFNKTGMWDVTCYSIDVVYIDTKRKKYKFLTMNGYRYNYKFDIENLNGIPDYIKRYDFVL